MNKKAKKLIILSISLFNVINANGVKDNKKLEKQLKSDLTFAIGTNTKIKNDKIDKILNLDYNKDIFKINNYIYFGIGSGVDIFLQNNNNYYIKTYIKTQVYRKVKLLFEYTGNYKIANENPKYNNGFTISTKIPLYKVSKRDNAQVSFDIRYKYIKRNDIDEKTDEIIYFGLNAEL